MKLHLFEFGVQLLRERKYKQRVDKIEIAENEARCLGAREP